MTIERIERPVWRRFRPRYRRLAIAHARRGGAAVVVPAVGPLEVLLPVDADGRATELARWAIFAIEQKNWRRVTDGPAKGLATARIKEPYEGSVLDWCARDAVHEGATRTVELDCLACAACCHDSNVVLDDADLDRFRDAGRPELAKPQYVKRARDGKITLRFLGPGPCQHLREDKACAIYSIRPDNCRVFVQGSEACLAAREDTLGLRDGAPPA